MRTGLLDDVYTTLVDAPAEAGGAATIGVLVHPLTVWLWIGAGLMGFGTLLAAVPGKRRKGTEATSARVRTRTEPVTRPARTAGPAGDEVADDAGRRDDDRDRTRPRRRERAARRDDRPRRADAGPGAGRRPWRRGRRRAGGGRRPGARAMSTVAPPGRNPDTDAGVPAHPAGVGASADDELLLARPGPGPGRWIALGVAVALVAAFLVLLVGAKRPADKSVLPGRPAPGAETAYATIDGGTQSLAALRGRYVVLNFFASWCVPCEQEHPELLNFQQRHSAAGDATVVQVLFNDKPDAARRFFDERGSGGWPVLVDPTGRFALDYGVTGPPETYIIDRQGVVIGAVKGGLNDALLEDALNRAKQGPTAP